MRIERVVAGTFSEASERARQRFGRDALVLSTSKVGNVTELLVCVDLEEEPAPVVAVTPAAAAGFRAALDDELQPVEMVVETTSERLAERTSRIDPEDGSKLVAAIRAELHALEKRLAVATTPAGLSDGMRRCWSRVCRQRLRANSSRTPKISVRWQNLWSPNSSW